MTANDAAIKKAIAQFLDTEGTPGDRPAGESPPNDSRQPTAAATAARRTSPSRTRTTTTSRARRGRLDRAGQALRPPDLVRKKHDGDPMIDFPVYYPTRLVAGSVITNDSRAFPIDGPEKDVFHGYKMVVDVPGDGSATASPTSTTASRAPTGSTRRSCPTPRETRTIDGQDLPALLRRRPPAAGRLEDPRPPTG